MRDNFIMKIETLHSPDRGTLENAHNLSDDLLKKREVQFIDIASDPITGRDYKLTEDPTKFKSSKTNRGPLLGKNWKDTCEPVMCAYKLVTLEFKWRGIQGRTEAFIMRQEARLFLNFHRQVFCWIDRWHGLTMQDIRAIESETQRLLDEQRQRGPLRGLEADDN